MVNCLENRKATLGLEHPSTIASMSTLAALYTRQEAFHIAEELYLDCLERVSTNSVLTQY